MIRFKSLYALLTLVLLACVSEVFPSFLEWTTFLPYWNNLYGGGGLTFNGKGVGVSTLDGLVLFRTTDGGKNWSKVRRDTQDLIIWLGFADSNNLLAISGRTIRLSGDAGTHWVTESDSFPDLGRFALGFADHQIGVAIGFQGKIARTTDGGRTWSMIDPMGGTPFDVSEIAFATEKVGIAVGDGKIARTTDGGLTWNPIDPGFTVGQLKTVAFADSLRGFASGSSKDYLKTLDGGATWTVSRPGFTDDPRNIKIAFGSAGVGVMVRESSNYRTQDYGATWIQMDLPSGPNTRFASSTGPGPGDWAVSRFYGQGYILSQDSGKTWSKSVMDVYAGNTRSLAVLSGGKAVGVGDSGAIVEYLHLSDSNREYFPVGQGLTFENLEAVAFKDSLNVYAAGAHGTFLRSDDGGDTWEPVTAVAGDTDIHGLAFSKTGIGCMVGSQGMIKCSQDGGTSWSLGGGDKTEADLRAVAFPDSNRAVAVGDSGSVLLSDDGGASWSRLDDGNTERNLRCIAFKDRLSGLSGGSKGLLIQTKDGGQRWSPYPPPIPDDTILSLSISDSGMVVAVLSGSGGVWGNILGDGKWNQLSKITGLQSFGFMSKTQGLAVGLGGKNALSAAINGTLTAPELLLPHPVPEQDPKHIRIAWRDVFWADRYRVLVSKDTGFAQLHLDTLMPDSGLVLEGLDSSTSYYWKVTPRNGFGDGPASKGVRILPAPSYLTRTSSWSDWSRWSSPAEITCMGPRDSILWMSTKGGLARIPIQGGPATVYSTSNSGIPFNILVTLDVSYQDQVLMGSPDGAVVLEGGRWTPYTYHNAPLYSGDGNHLVSGITRTKDGMLWLATRSLTFTFNDIETDFNSYNFDILYYAVFEGDQGSVFAFDGNQWYKAFGGLLDRKNGIETVLGIVSDPDGNTWSASRTWYRGSGTWLSIQKGDSKSRLMVQQYSQRYSQGPTPWINGMQTTGRGLWAAYYGKYYTVGSAAGIPSDIIRSILFIPKDTAKVTVPIVLSTQVQIDNREDAKRFSGPVTVFSLDTAGNPWVLVRDTLYGHEQDGTRFGAEILPPELASQGPFREMRIDKRGVIYLRNDRTVFWKVNPKQIPVGVSKGGKGDITLVRGRNGLQLNLPSAVPVVLEYLDLQGRRTQTVDLGIQPAGTIQLPAFQESGSILLKVEAGAARKYFLMGPTTP